MHLKLPRGLAANIQISTCIAFLGIIIVSVNTITPSSSSNNNVYAIPPDVVNDKTQVFYYPTIPVHSSYASPALMTGESVISAPSNFNKIALQEQEQRQQQQQQQQQHHQTRRSVRQEDLTSLDNKREQHDGHAAVAAVTGKNSHENNNATNASDDTKRNGFHDKINISNQRNEFNGRPESTPSTATGSVSSGLGSASSSSSSFFERVELQESSWTPYERQQLLLHRQKRYLLFPEGSSFQMVFDLIIGVVDYTSYAILGITCAVAWELPSKPPSELIENIRDKLNDGTLALARRNDTAGDDIKYIDRNDGGAGNYGNQAQVSATVAAVATAATSDRVNYENGDRKPMATSAPSAPATSSSYYYNNPSVKHLNPYAPTSAASGTPQTPPYDAYYSQRPTSVHNNFNSAANNKNFALYDKSQRKTLYRNGDSDASSDDYTTFNSQTKPYSKYYKNVNGVSSTSGYVSADKQTFADWHRPSTSEAHQSDKYGDRGNKYYHNDYQQPQQQYTQGHGSWDDNNKSNWWQRNKQRVENNWREKQHIWAKYETEASQNVQPNTGSAAGWRRDKPAVWAKYENESAEKTPVTTYAAPMPSIPATRTGRNRKILRAPPKHRIYPVFGKRRRRRSRGLSRSKDMDTFELKLQQIHLREHLQSRQKLYGKIEQLYKVRGHNGTACVLRALCETGQRRRHHHHHQQHMKPQSFITELLRAIFVLPEDEMDMKSEEEDKLQSSELNAHIAARYREAHATDADSSCSQRFPMCEHNIWKDV